MKRNGPKDARDNPDERSGMAGGVSPPSWRPPPPPPRRGVVIRRRLFFIVGIIAFGFVAANVGPRLLDWWNTRKPMDAQILGASETALFSSMPALKYYALTPESIKVSKAGVNAMTAEVEMAAKLDVPLFVHADRNAILRKAGHDPAGFEKALSEASLRGAKVQPSRQCFPLLLSLVCRPGDMLRVKVTTQFHKEGGVWVGGDGESHSILEGNAPVREGQPRNLFGPEAEVEDTPQAGSVVQATIASQIEFIRFAEAELQRIAQRQEEEAQSTKRPTTRSFELGSASPDEDSGLGTQRYPMTASKRLSRSDIQSMDLDQLQYALNEMLARHSAYFKEDEIRRQFELFSWYQPDPSLSFDEIEARLFSQLERDNFKLLAAIRNEKRAGGLSRDTQTLAPSAATTQWCQGTFVSKGKSRVKGTTLFDTRQIVIRGNSYSVTEERQGALIMGREIPQLVVVHTGVVDNVTAQSFDAVIKDTRTVKAYPSGFWGPIRSDAGDRTRFNRTQRGIRPAQTDGVEFQRE